MPLSGEVAIVIRPSDCDGYGHVNNAVYASYFEFALAICLRRLGRKSDWLAEGQWRWEPRQLTLDYRQPAAFGDRLAARIWLSDARELFTFGCEIRRLDGLEANGSAETVVLRATGAWRLDGLSDQSPPPDLSAFPAEAGKQPRPFALPENRDDVRRYRWSHQVMQAEVNSLGQVHLQAVYQWLQEGVHAASSEAGWPPGRWSEAGLFVLQTRHDTIIHELPATGEPIIVESRLAHTRRWRGTWLQEVRREDGTLLVRDYSTGHFLSLAGRPTNPPAALLTDLQAR